MDFQSEGLKSQSVAAYRSERLACNLASPSCEEGSGKHLRDRATKRIQRDGICSFRAAASH